jgi:hypothetical protein
MKKKLLTLVMFMMVAFYSFSQFELKFEPISLIFGQVPLSAEYVISKSVGIEGTVGYSFGKDKNFSTSSNSQGLVVNGLFKFYFNPEKGGDKFYAFPYIRNANRKFNFTNNNSNVEATYKAFGLGFGVGYKIVAESGLLFDIGLGVGKNFSGGYTYSDPTYTSTEDFFIPINVLGRISIGYRFGGGK